MEFDEIQPGQRVRLDTHIKRYQFSGTVVAKEYVDIAGVATPRIYIDSDDQGRKLAHPAKLILEEV